MPFVYLMLHLCTIFFSGKYKSKSKSINGGSDKAPLWIFDPFSIRESYFFLKQKVFFYSVCCSFIVEADYHLRWIMRNDFIYEFLVSERNSMKQSGKKNIGEHFIK